MSFIKEMIGCSNIDNSTVKEHDNTYNKGNFVPAACHYDENTILNKNGELLQIIKIEDYVLNTQDTDLRTIVRNSITSSITVPEVSFWIYTIRKLHKFDLSRESIDDVSDVLHDTHMQYVNQQVTYINELYIAVVTHNLPESIKGILGALSFPYVKNKHKEFLKNKVIRLNKITSSILENLKEFEARKLGLLPNSKGKIRSELIEFFFYLTTMRYKECLLDMTDIAGVCAHYDIHMGFNTFKISDRDTHKFGAILAIKDYHESPLDSVDQCLQQDCEFMIVEIMKFTKGKNVVKFFQKQAKLLEVSNDVHLRQITNIDEFVSTDVNSCLDFCERKIDFVITSDTLKQLHNNIDKFIVSLSSLGILCVRCDLTIEDDFWAHLPGNFSHVLNIRYTLTKYACTFALLHYFPSGALQGNKWGQAVTIFFSNKGRPYFFSFHVKGNGHTLVVGSPQSSVTMLLNFLLLESRKFNTRIILLDYRGKSIIFTKAINGEYYRADHRPDHHELSFDLFRLEDNSMNRKIISGILQRMSCVNIEEMSEEMKNTIDEVVEYIFNLPMEDRNISSITDYINKLGKNAHRWINNGEFAHILNDGTNIDWNAKILGLNVGIVLSKPQCASVLIYYFLHVLVNYLDGTPTILVVDEAWILDYVFRSDQELDDWVEMMSQLNVVIVFSGENIPAVVSSHVICSFNKHVETQIFMPNSVSTNKLYMKAFNLSKTECNTMFQMPSQEGYFFVKQCNVSIVLSFQLPDIPEVNVLTATQETIRYMYESINSYGSDVKKWLPAFYNKCSK
ncbi:hypothetical protein EDL79_04495 [Ehrlichia ruminantium]|uniref:CagE TrbE VirB component of type IV transporter system central domain-containing protein n=1 Tax=Ehrlichia ruminantium TaxID=779 RepID=A0AAE6UJU2_EHRRU|nr:hypothetical protein [Ehrlichia ruminantium]QGR02866.1 hypothetical protein EDL81_04475 [Ehrlichia ruminantium]QGR03791.1 hypothetical protein EDL80_04485 [Ehrlichia ruminantium]QGR04718.1 hypothetical protein EDL79_04495 [Ehrlichia ruminantium]